MPLERDEVEHIIERVRDNRGLECPGWRYRDNFPPGAQCWTSDDNGWHILTFRGEHTYTIGRDRRPEENLISLTAHEPDDEDAVEIVLMAVVDPEKAMAALREDETVDTDFVIGFDFE